MPADKSVFQKYFMFIGLATILVVFAFFSWIRDQIAFDQIERKALIRFKNYEIPKTEKYLPPFQVVGPDGEMVNLPDMKHYTVLNIWSTRCKECVKGLLTLGGLKTILSYNEDWKVYSVSIDKEKDMKKVYETVKRSRVKDVAGFYDINQGIRKNIPIKALPMTLILDNRGRILYELYGNVPWYDSNITDFLRYLPRVKVDRE